MQATTQEMAHFAPHPVSGKTKKVTAQRDDLAILEPVIGFEPTTHSLQNCCAAVAPHWLAKKALYRKDVRDDGKMSGEMW